MRPSLTAAIAGFAGFASAEVLLRLATDGNLDGRTERVLFPIAFAGLAASLCVLAALAIAAVATRRSAGARVRCPRKPNAE